jgi:hypothetical protein
MGVSVGLASDNRMHICVSLRHGLTTRAWMCFLFGAGGRGLLHRRICLAPEFTQSLPADLHARTRLPSDTLQHGISLQNMGRESKRAGDGAG